MARAWLLLAAILGLLRPLQAMVEQATGIDFKPTIDDKEFPGVGSNVRLAGMGARVKKIGPVSVKVYAVGLYVDERAVQSSLNSFEAFPEDTLLGSKAFFKAIRKAPFDKHFQLKMARTVGSEKMVNALADSVKPKMKNEMDALSEFQGLLSSGLTGGSCAKNTAFGFAANKGKLVVSINGKEEGTVISRELCDALTDTYIGENAVSPDAKASFAKGICAMLKGK